LALNASKRAIGVEGEVMTKRDYSLLGPDGKRAVEIGLAAAEWYHTEVPRKVMKDLMQRSDQPALSRGATDPTDDPDQPRAHTPGL
jgi:hypothetical protein